MKLKQQIKQILFKQREIHINTFFIEVRINFVLAIPLRFILIILSSSLAGLLFSKLIY